MADGGDSWDRLKTGPFRVARWLAAVAIIGVSWYVQGSSHDGAEVIYPLVLAGLMFAPDLRKIAVRTPLGDVEGDLDQRRAAVSDAEAAVISQASRSTRTEGEATPLAELAGLAGPVPPGRGGQRRT